MTSKLQARAVAAPLMFRLITSSPIVMGAYSPPLIIRMGMPLLVSTTQVIPQVTHL